MGKATIIEHKGESLYRVKIRYDLIRVERKLADGAKNLIDANGKMTEVEEKIPDAEQLLADKKTKQNALIVDLKAFGTEKEKKAVIDATSEVLVAARALGKLRSQITQLEMQVVAIEKEIKYLEDNTPKEYEADIWCCDWQTELSGDVGTIEVPAQEQAGSPIIIKPGGTDGDQSKWALAEDGVLQPAIAGEPFGTFLAAAWAPAFQYYYPQYRFGVLTDIDNVTEKGSVELLPAEIKKFPGNNYFNINKYTNFIDVPLQYKQFGRPIYSENDRVVVKFLSRDWKKPMVIGHMSHPKMAPGILVVTIVDESSPYVIMGGQDIGHANPMWWSDKESLLKIINMIRGSDSILSSIRIMPPGNQNPLGYHIYPQLDDTIPTGIDYAEMPRFPSQADLVNYVDPLLKNNPNIKYAYFAVDNSGSMSFDDIEPAFLGMVELLEGRYPYINLEYNAFRNERWMLWMYDYLSDNFGITV